MKFKVFLQQFLFENNWEELDYNRPIPLHCLRYLDPNKQPPELYCFNIVFQKITSLFLKSKETIFTRYLC